ncbi:hypothetical protein LRR18_14445, partial [Mangrovimonas sp. AS39]|uniref:hypothetical protein n=3 Tax=Mangrovimonas futianensis TaxID=2895523 RepID=UPI001E287731
MKNSTRPSWLLFKKTLIQRVFYCFLFFGAFLFSGNQLYAQCSEPQCQADPAGNGPSPCEAKLYCSNSSSTTNGIIACTQAADTDGCGVTTTTPIANFPNSGYLSLFSNQIPANESSCYIDPDDGQPYDYVQWIKFATPEFINSVKLQGVGQMEAWTVFYAGSSAPQDVTNPVGDCNSLIASLDYVEGACSNQNQWKTWINEDAVVQAGVVNVYYIALFYNQSSVENGGDINFKTKDCDSIDFCVPEVECPQTDLTFCEGSGDDSDNGAIETWLNGFTNNDCGNALSWTLTGEGINTAFDGFASTIAGLAAGTYTLTNSLVNGSGGTITSCSANIIIYDNPEPSVGDASGCEGEDITLDGPSGYVGYSWSFGGSEVGTSEDLTITGATSADAGVYTLTVTDNNGCSGSDTATVTVYDNPEPSVGDASDCEGEDITLDGPSGYVGYSWSFGGSEVGTSEDLTITGATSADAGVYTLTVTDNNGCSGSDTATVTVYDNPEPSVGDASDCEGEDITLDGPSGYVGYSWSFGGSEVGTSEDLTITGA